MAANRHRINMFIKIIPKAKNFNYIYILEMGFIVGCGAQLNLLLGQSHWLSVNISYYSGPLRGRCVRRANRHLNP